MNWTDVFPVLHDEMVDEFEAKATRKERKELADWFEVKEVVNRREVGHILSVSLFWKNIRSHQPDIVIKDRAMFMGVGRRRKLLRFDPWKYYAEPLIQGALWLQANRPDVAFRVYLAADLEFLIPDLVSAGCEVQLMKSCSIRHNPGAMWRFLAFEETGKLVTVVDADRAAHPLADIVRTETTAKAGLGFWRVPVWGELNDEGNLNYRPIVGCQMGCTMSLPARLLMEALIWQTRRGGIAKLATPPGALPVTVHGTVWPDYGFDEWFLQAALYPRAAFEGLLTFVPASAKSQLLPLDIEFAMWANPASEIQYFGWADGGCCAPAPVVEKPKAPRLPISREPVLLTGIWQVKTANDAILISELWEYAAEMNWPVLVKPVLHLKNPKVWKQLPSSLRKQAVVWESLDYNVKVQNHLKVAVTHGSSSEWIWQADSDERVDFAAVGGLARCLRRASSAGADYIPGEWIDRVRLGGPMPPLQRSQPLHELFPIGVRATRYFQNSLELKVALHRRDCPTGVGNHQPENKKKRPTPWSIPIWHFKWHSDCPRNQAAKIEADQDAAWIWEFRQSLDRMGGQDGPGEIDWESLPKEAWVKSKAVHRKGRYPLMMT